MTLYILGAGSIGLLYASWMRNAAKEYPLRLLLQSHHANKLMATMRHGVNDVDTAVGSITTKIRDIHGRNLTQNVPSEFITKCTGEGHPFIRNILLTTKAPQAVNALESIIHRFHPTKKVNLIVMTNGSLAVVDGIKHSLKENDLDGRVEIISASTTHGAMRVQGDIVDSRDSDGNRTDAESFQVVHTGLGYTFIEDSIASKSSGIGCDSLQKTLNRIWNEVGLRSTVVPPDEMYVMNWKKLAANCAINPLTALRNCTNGELLSESSESHQGSDGAVGLDYTKGNCLLDQNDLDFSNPSIFNQLVEEVSNVALADARRKGYKDDNDYPSAIDELKYDRLLPFVESVAQNTAKNKSSMLQDVLSKRYPTEVMHLNGYVARLGLNVHGIEVPANQYVTEEIERITKVFNSE